MKEDLTNGQKISSFRIYGYLPHYKHKRVLLFEGRTVGHKVFCRFNAIRASKFEVEICGSEGAALADVKAYFVR